MQLKYIHVPYTVAFLPLSYYVEKMRLWASVWLTFSFMYVFLYNLLQFCQASKSVYSNCVPIISGASPWLLPIKRIHRRLWNKISMTHLVLKYLAVFSNTVQWMKTFLLPLVRPSIFGLIVQYHMNLLRKTCPLFNIKSIIASFTYKSSKIMH